MSCTSSSMYSESSGGSVTSRPSSIAACRARWSIAFRPPASTCFLCASGTTTLTKCSPLIMEQYTWHSSKDDAANAPSPLPNLNMYTGWPCLVYPWNGEAGMIFLFSDSKSHRGFPDSTASTPLDSPTAMLCLHAIVSRIIFSASSTLYFRATRNLRAVAFLLPHGHISTGISSPSVPKRSTNASTVSRQSSGCGYSWNTAPLVGAAAAASFSSPLNQVPNIVGVRYAGYHGS